MFEESDDAALIDVITGSARAEAAAAARRFAGIAELTERRCASELATARELWACDGWDSAAAELAAAQTISHRAAGTLMHQALALRHRLPEVGALLAAGAITAKMATTATWRTHLIEDPEVVAAVDAELAATITSWGPLAPAKLETAVDAVIDRHDPAAVLAHRSAVRRRDVQVGAQDDDSGTSSLWGRLLATDGELLTRRLEAMAKSVCRSDPRSLGERRSDALGVLIAGGELLPCRCDAPDCPHTGTDARAEAIVITVLTNHHPNHPDTPPGPTGPSGPTEPSGPTGSTGPSDPSDPTDPSRPSGPTDPGGPTGSASPAGPAGPTGSTGPAGPTPTAPTPAGTAATPHTTARSCPQTAVIAGGPVIPAALLTELVRIGALTHVLPDPTTLGAEPGYRPSTRLARFVRARDLTCCFPGCHRPAEHCDLDHRIAHAARGLTHPANLRCLCRKHHLLKTFWTGRGGWADEQLADGTVIWTSPTGHRYRSPPGSRLHFPDWDTTTPVPLSPATVATGQSHSPDRGLAMPRRKRSRTAEHTARIRRERQHNQHTIDNNPAPF